MKSMYSGTDKLTGYDSLSYKKLLESVLVETKKAIPNDIEKELEERKQRERKIEFIKNSRRKKFYIISLLIAVSSLFISTFIIIPEKLSSIFIFSSI